MTTTQQNPAFESTEVGRIDASLRTPGLLFCISGAFWLVFSSLFALLYAAKLVAPGLLSTVPFLTFGTVKSVSLNALTHGWATNAAFALILWIMSRLSERAPDFDIRRYLVVPAGVVYNIFVTLGILSIFWGEGRPYYLLEIPGNISGALGLSFIFISVWTILDYCRRKRRSAFISQHFILGAVFWLAWTFSIVQLVIGPDSVPGVVQAVAASWFAHAYIWLWLTPVALAVAYFLLPKLLGLPIRNYYLSFFGFWCLAFFAPWGGTAELVGGPVPVWIQVVGYVSGFLMIIPITSISINLIHTALQPSVLKTNDGKNADIQFSRFFVLWNSPTGRFIGTGVIIFPIFGLLAAMDALPGSRESLQFTYWQEAISLLGIHGFFSMILFGGIYFMLPRLLGREWPSSNLMTNHFNFSVIGFVTIVVCYLWAGSSQASAISDIHLNSLAVVKASSLALICSIAGFLFLLLGHVCFLINLVRITCECQSKSNNIQQGPALLNQSAEERIEA
ncbi:MAG: hypothetical protein HN675_13635 [Opitutae bacterium]|nr:hypothetical protein [Opitutae bacterium]